MDMSLQDYYDRIVWLNLTVYFVYIAIKYIPMIVYLVKLCVNSKCRSETSQENSKPSHEKPYDRSCLCFLSMVFGKQLGLNKWKEENAEKKETTKKQTTGKKKTADSEKQPTENEQTAEKKHKLYLQEGITYSSRCWQITVLHIAVFESVVLALGSALDLTLFAVTYVCTEDPSIDCYPQSIYGNDTSLNITVDSPIKDCSFWNSYGISERVTFLCFQRTYSFEQFLAYSGGILALTIILIRTALGLIISLKKYFTMCTRIFSIVTAEIVLAVLLVLHLVLGSTKVSADSNMDTREVMFLTSNLADIIILCGTITTLLWLPWEKYGYPTKNNSGAQQAPNSTQNKMV